MNRILFALAFIATASSAFSQAGEGYLYDATGKRIGPLYPGAQPRVLTHIGGQPIAVELRSPRFGKGRDAWVDWSTLLPGREAYLYFDTEDCTGPASIALSNDFPGQPMVEPWRSPPGALPSVTSQGNRESAYVFVGEKGVQPKRYTYASTKRASPDGDCLSAYFDNVYVVVPVVQIIKLSDYFTPPYSLR